MLVLTRKLKEQIQIGDNITISILRVKGNSVRIGIQAPRDVRVARNELPALPATSTHDSGHAAAGQHDVRPEPRLSFEYEGSPIDEATRLPALRNFRRARAGGSETAGRAACVALS